MSWLLHVAIDAHNLGRENGGIARYVRELLLRLARRADVDLTLLVHERFACLTQVRLQRVLPAVSFRIARTVPAGANVVWHPWNGTFFTSRTPAVATIHDTSPFDFPAAGARRRSQQEPFVLSARTASTILTVSEYSAGRIADVFGVTRKIIVVTPLAAASAFTPQARVGKRLRRRLERQLRGRSYLLCISGMDPIKNFDLLYAAWCRAFPNREMALVATGVRQAVYPEAIVLPTSADPRELAGLYAASLFLVVPSLLESFPLPVVEAMSAGTPVLANRVGGLPEVGGHAAFYVEEPRDLEGWTRALRRLSDDATLRADLRARGLGQASRFSWDRTEETTYSVLRFVAEGKVGGR